MNVNSKLPQVGCARLYGRNTHSRAFAHSEITVFGNPIPGEPLLVC